MATLNKRVSKKDGLIRFGIQAKIKDKMGKSKFYCTTWQNPDHITNERQAKKEAEIFAQEWERKLRKGIFINKDEITFNELAMEWRKTSQKNFSETYNERADDCLARIVEFFGDVKLKDLTARDVQKFFSGLRDYTYTIETARLKEQEKENFNELVKAYGVNKVASESKISDTTLFAARKCNAIRWKCAELICQSLKIKADKYFDKIVKADNYKRNTILKYKNVLSDIFQYGIRAEIIDKDYASMTYQKDYIPKAEQRKETVLSQDDFQKLINVLKDKPTSQSIPIYLLATTGMRRTEMCGLEWQDIDFDNRTLSIERDRVYVSGKGVIRRNNKTKNESSKRTIPICDVLYEKLIEHKAYYDTLKANDPTFDLCGAVYCSVHGKPASPDNVGKMLKSFLTEAGCEQVSTHRLRHTFVTTLLECGTPVSVVSKIVGHSSSQVTLSVYTHYRKEADNSKEVLNKIFANKKTPQGV